MPETTSEQDQQKKPEAATQPARQPAREAPQPDWEASPPALSLGPGLGSPDGFEKRLADSRQQRGANRQERVQTLTAMQRQFGNQHVQRFMVQRQSAGRAPVQREEKKKDVPPPVKIDEVGVTQVHYNKPTFTTKNEKADPAAPPKGVKPEDDLVTVTGTAVCVFTADVKIDLPHVPEGLTACQAKRVKDAIDNKLSPHEDQHKAAMKTYEGTVEEAFTITGVKRAGITAALNAKAKEIADRLQGERQTSAQKLSDALDTPPFVVNVDMDCEDEKPEKKSSAEGGEGAQPEMAGGEGAPLGPTAASESSPAPAENA